MSIDRYARFRRGTAPTSVRDLAPSGFRPGEPNEDERPVTRIVILVEYEGGGWREYDAVEPLDLHLSPGLAMSGAHTAGAALAVSFRANPRWNLRIWSPGRTSRDGIREGLGQIAEMLGCRLTPRPGLRSGLEAAVRAKAAEPGGGESGTCPHCGPTASRNASGEPDRAEGGVRERSAPRVHRGLAAAVPAEDRDGRGGIGPAGGDG